MLKKYYIVLAVAAFITDKKNRILIVKKSAYEKVDAGLWTVPGGKIRPDEPIVIGLKREVEEEVGLKITDNKWIGEDVFLVDDIYFHGQHFLCQPKKLTKVRLEKSLIDYRWIRKSDLKNYQFHPNIKKQISNLFRLFQKKV